MAFILPADYTILTAKQRRIVRELYRQQQKNKCCFCNGVLDKPITKEIYIDKSLFPTGFFNNPVHLHHNHDTGMTIGAVHAKCNAILWQYFGE